MHTTAYWLTIPRDVYTGLPFTPAERRDGVAGLGFALRSVAQLLLMCERHDIGLAIHGDDERSVGDEAPRLFVYDNYPGGIGFSEPLFGMHLELLQRTRQLVSGCGCETGCPACIGPAEISGAAGKVVVMGILDALLGERST